MLSRFGAMMRRISGPTSAGQAVARGGAYALVPQARLQTLFGPPQQPRPTEDKILADVWAPPYRGPLELDRYGAETQEMRIKYREQYGTQPVARAAIRGKADALSCLEVTVLPGDKDNKTATMAAEWLDWTVQRSPRGWRGIIDAIYTPASIDGFSLCEKKLEPQIWKGKFCWGLAHIRSLDSALLRLQLDVYRNVVGIVNLVRGIEYYSPDDVILHSHNSLFANPFGHSDLRATTRAANIIEDVYRVWYIALKVYGLPYMTGKAKPTNKLAMAAALTSLRQGGYAVTDQDESIEVINLAAAAATDGFERMVQTQREDTFFAIRGASLPFLEGDGGQNAHGDSGVQKSASDAGEYASALDVADTINRQLVPWLVGPNFGYEIEMPRMKLGGTNWKDTKDLLDIITTAQQAGIKVSARWAANVTSIAPPDDLKDELKSAEQQQHEEELKKQQVAQAPPGGAPPAIGAAPPEAAPAAAPAEAPPAEPAIPAAGMSAASGSGETMWIAPSRLVADPKRFQFRHGHDAEDGTVRELPDEKFDPRKCKPLLAWRDPETHDENVVDGHHRLAWAERDGAKRIPVQWLDAKTAAEAKELGRRANVMSAGGEPPQSAVPSVFSATVPARVDVSKVVRELLAEMGA